MFYINNPYETINNLQIHAKIMIFFKNKTYYSRNFNLKSNAPREIE